MATANKNLVGVVVRTLDGKLSHIESYGKNGYRVAGDKNQIPMTRLVRTGRRLQVVEEEKVKAIPKGGDQILDGYLHIYNRDQLRAIKKGETPDIPVFDNWLRVDPKAPPKVTSVKVKEVKPKLSKAKAKSIKPAPKTKAADVAKVANEKATPVKTVKAKKPAKRTADKNAPASVSRDSNKIDVQETLRLVMHHARSNRKMWKDFVTVVSGSLGIEADKLPISAREIVEQFGVAKATKAVRAMTEHVNSQRAEMSLPRFIKTFLKTGEMKLSKQQTEAVVKALAPTIPEALLPTVMKNYFGNSVDFLVKVSESGATKTKTKPKSEKGEI